MEEQSIFQKTAFQIGKPAPAPSVTKTHASALRLHLF